ncbi:MAG: hypothetical protein QXY49_07085, partial [Thermofilaceae archaeon]
MRKIIVNSIAFSPSQDKHASSIRTWNRYTSLRSCRITGKGCCSCIYGCWLAKELKNKWCSIFDRL